MPGPIADTIAAVRAELASRPPGLLRHIERVLVEARQLADFYDVDPGRVELATWAHDLYRAHAPAELLRLAQEWGISISPADEASPVMLHGPVAAAVLRSRFDVTDAEVLEAVADHTSGSPTPSRIAAIILLADKVERRKRERTPVMADIRKVARRDLDVALLCWADSKWVDERRHGWDTHPVHWAARRHWVREHHADAALPGRTDEPEFSAGG